jgi:hypothetical protein
VRDLVSCAIRVDNSINSDKSLPSHLRSVDFRSVLQFLHKQSDQLNMKAARDRGNGSSLVLEERNFVRQ